MNEKDTCPKCNSGLMFEDTMGGGLRCLICGNTAKASKVASKQAKRLSLGQYMAGYPGVASIRTVATASHRHECIHNQDVVNMGPFKVWLSELPALGWKRRIPDLGVYMAEPWLAAAGSVLTNGISLAPVPDTKYDVIYIRWADRGIVEVKTLVPVVSKVIEYLEEGCIVELGCFGGHGRTGTVAACLLGVMEKLDGEQAVKELRTRYCLHAIEGKDQENLVVEFCKEIGQLQV